MKRWFLLLAVCSTLSAPGCMQYRQTALGVSPAPSPYCPDMARGCGKTVWSFAWGVINVPELKKAECGDVGMHEVTVRATPITFAIGLVTAGIVTPRRVEWKCVAPNPDEGDLDSPGGG